jgi:hypothetical protein
MTDIENAVREALAEAGPRDVHEFDPAGAIDELRKLTVATGGEWDAIIAQARSLDGQAGMTAVVDEVCAHVEARVAQLRAWAAWLEPPGPAESPAAWTWEELQP